MGRFAEVKEPPPRCSVGLYIEGLPDEDAEEITKLIQRRDDHGDFIFSHRAIRQLILDVGDPAYDRDTIRDHRTGKCRCRATS